MSAAVVAWVFVAAASVAGVLLVLELVEELRWRLRARKDDHEDGVWPEKPTRPATALDVFFTRVLQVPESPEVRDQADADDTAALALIASPVDDTAWCAGHGIDWKGLAR